MLSTYKYQGVTWIDLETPTEDELLHVLSQYNVPEYLTEELVTETILSKVNTYENMVYLVLHFPRVHNEKRMPDLEIDFIIGKDFLITVHYEFSNAIHDFTRNLELELILNKNLPVKHAGHVFQAIINESYKQANHKLDDLYQMLEGVKEQIYKGHEDRMVIELSEVNRKILDFKQALRFHDAIFKSLDKPTVQIFNEEFTISIESMRGELHKISSILDGHKELLLDLRETNDSLLSAKTNKTMRILTIMSFTTFPLTLVATMIAMITNVHIIETPEQFIYIAVSLLLIGTLIILHFKHKKWLL